MSETPNPQNDESNNVINSSDQNNAIINDINLLNSKSIYLITKNFDLKIPDILSYIESENFQIKNKLIILKYLEQLFSKIPHNSEIFSRKISNSKKNLKIFEIIIKEYVLTPNENENQEYLNTLKNLFALLLTQISFEKNSYHYLLSFIANYIDNIKNNLTLEKKINSENLSKILQLLRIYYQSVQGIDEPYNYLFFNGESDSYLVINNNKENILNFDDKETLNILIFIKLLSPDIIKQLYPVNNYKFLEIIFNEVSKHIIIGADVDNYLTINLTKKKLIQLECNKIINILVTIYRKDSEIQTEIYINNIQIYSTSSQKIISEIYDNDIHDNTSININNENYFKIDQLKLFKNFIGHCSNIILYKGKIEEISLPKFMLCPYNNDRENKETLKTTFINGIYKEEIFSLLILQRLKDEKSNNISKSTISDKNSENDITDFMEKNIISIYMPNRFITVDNSHLILKDSINQLDCDFYINSPCLNGIHLFHRLIDNHIPFGGLNHLLPFIELMNMYPDFLTSDNLCNFFNLVTFIFTPFYQKLLSLEEGGFFFNLSYFFEKIPDNYFDAELAYNLITISSFLLTLNRDINYKELIFQFHKYILLNEEIIFKFKIRERITIFHQIGCVIQKIDTNIYCIIKILLKYDKERYTKFCCKYHSEYFNQNSEYLDPNLMDLLKPIEEIIGKFFEKFVKETRKFNNKIESKTGNQLIKLYELLTYDISPCLQKIIISFFYNFIKKHYTKYFGILNINNKIIDISLFVYKNSIFDIKIDIIKFLYFIAKTQLTNNNENYLTNRTKSCAIITEINTFDKEKGPYMLNYILPYYLFGDGILSGDSNDSYNNNSTLEEDFIYNSVNIKKKEKIDVQKTKSEKKIQKTKKLFDVMRQSNYNENIKNKQNNSEKYNVRKISQNQQKIAYNYNQEKLHNLIYELYYTIFRFFEEENNITLNLNLLIKIVSKGDLNLINKFLFDIKNKISKESKLADEINNNINLLHWLLETGFQFYMLKQTKFDGNTFMPGINIGTSSINEEDCNKSIEIIENIIVSILKNSIFKMDYIFSWSKYYYELRTNKNKFVLVREYILKFLKEYDKLIGNEILKPENKINNRQKEIIYYLNLLFEFITYYKLSGSQADLIKDINIIYEELAGSFNHILLCEINNENSIYTSFETKWKDFSFYSKILKYFTPLWTEEKISKDESDIFSKFISGKNDIFINNLQILFYNFEDVNISNNTINKGIPVVYIIYYFFILLFNIGGNKNNMKNLFKDFKLFITLLIISTCTVTTTADKKKKPFPDDSQYKLIQETTRIILFHCLKFYVNAIDNVNENIIKYYLSKDVKEKLSYEYNCDIKNILIENFAYLLKLLNIIYKKILKDETSIKNDKKIITTFKSVFSEPGHIKKSGAYILFDQLYENLDIKKQKEKNFFDQLKSKSKINKLETIIKEFIDSTQVKQFFKSEKCSKEIIYPFAKYIEGREKLISKIIPIYDNRSNTFQTVKNFRLSPFYIQDCSYDKRLNEIIKKINKDVTKEILLNKKKIEIDKYFRIKKYIQIKKKLFSFRGIWSNENYFYDSKNYTLKYKIANHLTTDYSKLLMTPILNLDYYLPKFSIFKTNTLFRTLPNKTNIYYPVDLSFVLNNKELFPDNKDDNKITNNINDNISINDEKKINDENNNIINTKKKYNNLYNLKLEIYNFIEENSSNIQDKKIFLEHIYKKHLLKPYDIAVDACLVKTDFHISGIVYINSSEIGFYGYEPNHTKEEEGYDFDRKVCFGSIFKFQASKYKYYYIKIPYNEIILILKRTYYFKITALEFFTINNKSYLFRFNEINFKNIYDSIRQYMKPDIEDIYIEYTKYEDKIGFFSKKNYSLSNKFLINNTIKNMNLKYLYEKWYKWEISTFKILNIINLYANRTLNDINQYPVFPWIITDYTSEKFILNNNIIRSFNTPMGMMNFTEEAKERKENYLDTWANNELETDKEENYDRYGSHYSTSLYITYYLVRIFPFSSMRIELQGKKFDDPNRLFNSLIDSFECALTQKADLRELIPEMFCFPEMFYNINNLNLGEIKNEESKNFEEVNDILLPKWSNNNGYNFIYYHRKFLESPEISETINEWINIIFGYKQKGSYAKKIGNLFCKQTYEDFEEVYSKSKQEDKIYYCRMVEFGLTPHQIFKNEAYHRLNYSETKKKIQIFKNFTEFNKNQNGKILEISKETIIESNDYQNLIPYKLYLYKNDEEGSDSRKTFVLTDKVVKKYSRFNPISQTNRKICSAINLGVENIDIEQLNKIKNNIPIVKLNLTSQSEMTLFIPKYRMSFKESPNIFYNKGHYIALGGFWNGNIIVQNLIDNNNKRSKNKTKEFKIYPTCENSPIIHICLDQTETYAICGNLKGSIFVYIIDINKKSEWNSYKKIYDHCSEITSIAINENLNIFITCDKEGFCMIYTLPKCKLINSFNFSDKLPNDNKSNYIYCSNITLISHTPLPCFIFYFKEIKNLSVFSINLKYIKDKNLDFEITDNGIKKFTDQQFVDYLLIYNNKKNSIDIYSILDLNPLFSTLLPQCTFIDFGLWKELEDLVILVKYETNKNIYKILVMKTSSGYISSNSGNLKDNYSLCVDNEKESITK